MYAHNESVGWVEDTPIQATVPYIATGSPLKAVQVRAITESNQVHFTPMPKIRRKMD